MEGVSEAITMRRYLIEGVLANLAVRGETGNIFLIAEAVDSTAIEHPEWPYHERRTREEWAAWTAEN